MGTFERKLEGTDLAPSAVDYNLNLLCTALGTPPAMPYLVCSKPSYFCLCSIYSVSLFMYE